MQSLAQPWLVLQLTHSAFLVGLVVALQYLPVLALAPVGGTIADRFPKRRVLQLNWVTDEGVKRRELRRHRLSAGVKRLKRLFG